MSAEEALVVVPCAAFLAMGLFPFLHAVVHAGRAAKERLTS